MLRIVTLIVLLFYATSARATSTYAEEGAYVGASVGTLTANILALTVLDCEPATQTLCPGGRTSATFLWGAVGSAGGALLGFGLGALFKKSIYDEIAVTPVYEALPGGNAAYGLQMRMTW